MEIDLGHVLIAVLIAIAIGIPMCSAWYFGMIFPREKKTKQWWLKKIPGALGFSAIIIGLGLFLVLWSIGLMNAVGR